MSHIDESLRNVHKSEKEVFDFMQKNKGQSEQGKDLLSFKQAGRSEPYKQLLPLDQE